MLRQLKFVATAVGRASRRLCFSQHASVIAAGLALGGGAWIVVQIFFASVGFTHETRAALLLAAAVAVPAGRLIGRRFPALAETGLAAIFAAGWLALLPSIMNFGLILLDRAPSSFLTDAGPRLVCLWGAALIVVGLPGVCCAVISQKRSHREHAASFLLGLAGGLLLAVLVAAPIIGLEILAYAIAIATGLVWIVRQFISGDSMLVETSDGAADPISRIGRILAGLTVVIGGVIAGLLARLLVQLMPESPQLLVAGGAALLVGFAGGVAVNRRWDPRNSPLIGALILAVCALLPLAAFGGLISLQMHANAYVSSVPLLLAIRIGVVAVCFLPLGFGLAVGCRELWSGSAAGIGSLALFCLGLAGAPWLIATAGMTLLALISAGASVALGLPRLRIGTAHRWRAGLGVATAGCLLIGLAANVDRYSPSRSARLLFDASTLLSWKQGVPRRLLTALDERRMISRQETLNGTLTAWRSRGSAVSLRLDGIPLSLTSEDIALCPLPASEVLRVLLPMVLHDDPESLLLLSDPGGVGTKVAVEFPLRRITAYEEIAFGSAGDTVLPDPPEDERLTCRTVSGRLALLVEDDGYDVIVSAPGNLATFGDVAYLTRGFYQAAARHLNEGGIFCQRLRYSDFGPEPLRVISETMRGVFDRVLAVELGGGELALLGTVGEATVFREGLAGRLQRPQVCRVLANLGWDWSMPMNLKVIPVEQLAKFAEAAPRVNTTISGYLGHRLPLEMMRWGPKGAELQEATSGMAASIAFLAVPTAEREEVLLRIKAVSRQHEMMTRYPDQPWAYRKAVRKHLDETPRSIIKKVEGSLERVLHPEEQRRLDYFEALSDAIREIDEESLAELESFVEPYDPWITYFLHHEIAPLYEQLGAAGQARALAHRLHAAYFADPRDRSIRNIVSSINLLTENPKLISDSAERYDQLNGLLELLLRRWERRGGGIPSSPDVALADINKSLDALVKTVPVMRDLAADAGISPQDWSKREDAIERMLTRPLREYRAKLLPHRHAGAETMAKSRGTAGEGR